MAFNQIKIQHISYQIQTIGAGHVFKIPSDCAALFSKAVAGKAANATFPGLFNDQLIAGNVELI
ncbi:MAG: hypothetical protein ACJAYR_001315 [Sneathiella sp.]|jgi:hypothetical protein